MKGRTTCPKCKKEFVLDIPDNTDKQEVTCPNCSNNFTIKTTNSSDLNNEEECCWEEHGEPRKTILSSIKPKTNRPMIAAFLLAFVFIFGVSTAIFSEAFIETSLSTFSNAGVNGNLELQVIGQSNETLQNVSISIDDTFYGKTNINGVYSTCNISLGFKTLEISYTDYKIQTREILVYPFTTSSYEIKINEGIGEENISYDTIGCTLIIAIFSVFALLGAISSFNRRNLDVAIVGSIIGIFSFGFFLIGAIVSIVALIIILISRDEFENGKKGKIF